RDGFAVTVEERDVAAGGVACVFGDDAAAGANLHVHPVPLGVGDAEQAVVGPVPVLVDRPGAVGEVHLFAGPLPVDLAVAGALFLVVAQRPVVEGRRRVHAVADDEDLVVGEAVEADDIHALGECVIAAGLEAEGAV